MLLLFTICLATFLTPIKDLHADLKITWLSPGNGFKVARLIPNIDLAPQFGMNVKQIFLYVVAKPSGKQEMIWSKIVKNGSDYKFFELVQSNYLFDPNPAGRKIEFEIRGSLFPYTGRLLDFSYGKIIV